MEKNLKIETLRFEKVDGWFCGLYTPESKKTVVKRFTVTAEIYRVIQEGTSFYEKATNHYSDIEITLYSDGTAYCTSIPSNLPMPVRCLASGSYDFECNNGQIVYKFNTDEMF